MKTPTLLLLAFLHYAIPAMADILYVNNDTAYPADYRAFDDAFAVASAGDTIMLAGSTTSYGVINIVGKPIKLVGNKCLNNNAPGQPARADEKTTIIDYLNVGVISGGGEARLLANGTVIESIDVAVYSSAWSDGCTFKGCNFRGVIVFGSGNLFAGCRFSTSLNLDRHEGTSFTPVHVSPGTNNHWQNCIIRDLNAFYLTSGEFVNCMVGDFSTTEYFDVKNTAALTLRNCVISDMNIGNSGVYRVREKLGQGSTRLHHCLIVTNGPGDPIPSLSADLNNLAAGSSSEVFSDSFYTLQGTSSAVGAGESGVDIGIYGGPNPFEWGGSPALPLINKLNILEANPATGLTFRVEAEARD